MSQISFMRGARAKAAVSSLPLVGGQKRWSRIFVHVRYRLRSEFIMSNPSLEHCDCDLGARQWWSWGVEMIKLGCGDFLKIMRNILSIFGFSCDRSPLLRHYDCDPGAWEKWFWALKRRKKLLWRGSFEDDEKNTIYLLIYRAPP